MVFLAYELKHLSIIPYTFQLSPSHFNYSMRVQEGGLGFMTDTAAAVQATCRTSTYRPYRTAGRKAKYGRFSVLPRPEIYRNLCIKDSVKIEGRLRRGSISAYSGYRSTTGQRLLPGGFILSAVLLVHCDEQGKERQNSIKRPANQQKASPAKGLASFCF